MEGVREKKKSEEAPPEEAIPTLELFKFADKTDLSLIFLGTLASIANGASGPVMTLFLGKIIGAFLAYPSEYEKHPGAAKHHLRQKVNTQCLYFVYLAIGTFVMSYLQLVCWMVAGDRQSVKIRSEYFKAVMRQEMAWFDFESSGNISSRITADVNLIQDGISEKFGSYIEYISTFVSGFIIAYIKGWKLSLVMTAAIPVIVGTNAGITYVISTSSKSGQDSFGASAGLADEIIGSIKTIMAFGTQEKELKRYEVEIEKARKPGITKGFVLGVGFGLINLFLFFTYALGYWFGARLIVKHEMDSSKVVNVFFAIVVAAMALGQTASCLSALGSAQGAAFKIFRTIEKKSKIDSLSEEGLKPENIKGEIEFRNVDFAYPTRSHEPILKKLNLTIPAGKKVALVGSSGSGKSTTIQLIERFYDPESGDVILDGTNLKDINVNFLRQSIGLVGQEPVLFATTIYQNIAWGSISDTPPTLDEVIEACKLANAHDFIMKLPKNYYSVVGDKGGLLSGGQKQRIAIARAIIKNPKILLLDEATSALDTASEKIVQIALDKASINRTTIIIAHRLSTIKNADIICVMDKGLLIESGNHDELIQQEGFYYTLVKSQELKQATNNEESEKIEEDPDIIMEDDELSIMSSKKSTLAKTISKKMTKQEILESKKEKMMNQSTPFRRVFGYASENKLLIFIASFGTIIDGAVFPLFSFVFTNIIQKLSLVEHPHELTKGVNHSCIFIVILGVISFLSQICRQGFFEIVGQNMTKKVRYESLKAILKQEAGFFDSDENSVGILSSKLSSEADQIKHLVTDGFAVAFVTISSTAVSFGLAFGYGWKLSLVLIACFPALLLANYFQAKVFSGFSNKIKKAYENSAKLSSESVLNIRTVAALARQSTFYEAFVERNKSPHAMANKSAILGGIGFGLSQSLTYLFNATGFYYGSKLVAKGEYDIRNMFQVLTAIIFLGLILGLNAQYTQGFTKAKIAAIAFFELVDRTPQIDASLNTGDSREVDGNSDLKDVHFSYPTRKDTKILNGLTLTLPAGKSIALVGNSGSGKSTILGLLQRLYDANSGQVSVEGLNVKDWNLSDLRKNMAIVGQEPVLFNCSVAENIAYAKPDATHDDIVNAAKLSNAHDFITAFPNGYDTNVGERGGQLSGGQKQRIAIARALIRDPKILLLDEATSALDSGSEKVVQKAIENASKGRTSISIAHRLSSIQDCDLIVVMKDGLLVEMGDHDTLLANRSLYYELANQQNL